MDEKKFFAEFLRFFKQQELLAKFGHNKITKYLSSISLTWFTSRQLAADTIKRNLVFGLKLSDKQAEKERSICVKNFALSFLNIFSYKKMNRRWIDKNIICDQKDLLNSIINDGGMLMTFHSYHHNTMGCFFGILGAKVLGISAAKNPEHDNAVIRHYHINIMHNHSEKHFGGGHYLFLKDLKQTLKGIKKGLQEKALIIGSADFPAQNRTVTVNFLGQNVAIQRWLFDIAIENQKNIYFGILEGREVTDKLAIHLKKATANSTETLAQQYMDFLSERIGKNPACWQGWEWFHFLHRPASNQK